MEREVIIEHPPRQSQLRPVTRVRSTIVTSALSALKERGHYERWLSLVDPKSRELLVTAVAGAWLPLDLLLDHYAACDALGLSHDECVTLGSSVGARMHGSVLHAVRSLAATAGVTPWTAAARYDAFWMRLFDGGGFRITKVGPKDGLNEYFQVPLARFAYFRSAFCGVSLVGTSLFTTKAYVRVVSVSKDAFTIRTSWV
jgi:hypothetical protein